MKKVRIREARPEDLSQIAKINSQIFLGHRNDPESALQWMTGLFNASPVYRYFVAARGNKILGYAGWQWHGGFNRSEPVIELEQLGVSPKHQGEKIGPALVGCGFEFWLETAQELGGQIESHVTFTVWSYIHNQNAMSIYNNLFDEVDGYRKQYSGRAEVMLRSRKPILRPVR